MCVYTKHRNHNTNSTISGFIWLTPVPITYFCKLSPTSQSSTKNKSYGKLTIRVWQRPMCGNGLSFRGIRGRSFPLTTDRRRRPSLGRNDPPAAEVVHPELPASTAQTVSPNDYMETSQWKPQSIKRNRLQNSLLCRV